jgi:hypothetical protein
MAKITHIMGGWSPNIGNAFFQLGGYHLLKELLPEAIFSIINEKPGYPQYWNPKGGNPKNYFDMAAAVRSDYLVLMGPMFRPGIADIWQESLEKIISQGTKIILLGVACMRYEEEFILMYQKFLKKVHPYLLISRDEETYQRLGEYADYSYNGIDLAFFIPEYFPLKGLDNIDPYVVFNFDKTPEPQILIEDNAQPHSHLKKNEKWFEFEEASWHIKPDRWRTGIARRSRYLQFLEGLLFKGEQIQRIGNYPIIRTDHRYTPIIKQKTFRYPNVMVNDTPYPYFQIYGNAKLILSNRLHACVIGLSYGNPVMLFSETPRLRLIERLNLVGIKDHPVWLDLKELETEKQKMKLFLREILRNNVTKSLVIK